MVWVQIVMIFLGLCAIVTLIIYNLVKGQEEKQLKDVDENPPRIKIFGRTAFTNGHCEGFVVRDLPRKNGCHLIEFYPTDFKHKKDKKRPAIQSIVIHEKYLDYNAEGTISGQTTQIFAAPPEIMDLPKQFRSSFLGKKMEEKSEDAFVEKEMLNRRKRTLQAVTKANSLSSDIGFVEQFVAGIVERVTLMQKVTQAGSQNSEEKKDS